MGGYPDSAAGLQAGGGIVQLMPRSPFQILFDHLDDCEHGCSPSGSPLCQDGRALFDAAVKAASLIGGIDADALEPTAKA